MRLWMRLRVLRTASAYERRPRWRPGRLPAPAALRPTLPVVWGLQLFPREGGVEELTVDRALSTVNDTALCGRFGQHILAGTHGKAASGRWYVLAAGGRAVNRIEVTGQVRGAAGGPTLAVRAPRDASVQLTATLREGGTPAAVR